MCLLQSSSLSVVRGTHPLSFTNTVTFLGSYFISRLMTSTISSLSAHQISVPARYLSPGFCSVAPVRFRNHPSVPCLTLPLLSRASSCPELLYHCCYEGKKEKKKKKTAALTTHKQGHLGPHELLYCQSLCPCGLADTQ